MSKCVVNDLLKIFKCSVSAVLPSNLIRNSLKYCKNTQELIISENKFNLQKKNVYIVGAGKAVQYMALEVVDILESKIKTGIVSVPIGSLNENFKDKNIKFYEGATNNLPDVNAESTARKIEKLAISLNVDDILIVLLSGGGSALLSLPKPPITLEEKTNLIKSLANSGADIKELNTVRKRLSDLKGGQLAIKAYPAQVVSLILSDIVDNPLHLIASGPTTEDEDNPSEAMNIINKYQLEKQIPQSIASILSNPPDYKRFPKDNVHNFLIGSNDLSTKAAYKHSINLGYTPIIVSNSVTGNVKKIARKYVTMTKLFCQFLEGKVNSDLFKNGLKSIGIPGISDDTDLYDNLNKKTGTNSFCLILGGEITVEVKGSGKGGRSQQLALEFSKLLHNVKDELKEFIIHFLSAGTDGIDGPTDAAGAIGYIDLLPDAERDGINVDMYLENNDSYNFYKIFRNGELHVITGHTNTNVMDIHLIVIQKKL